MNTTIYLKMERGIEINVPEVKVGDIVKILSDNKKLTEKISNKVIIKQEKMYKNRYIVSILKVIEIIGEIDDSINIVNIGETDCVVELKPISKNQCVLNVLKVILVSLVLFFGAGFSIMAFNNDIDVHKLFEDVVFNTAGNNKMALIAIKVGYSLGLAIGIIVFYNHFGSRKITDDPTPIEVQMRTYEDDIYSTLIEEHNCKKGRENIKW